MTTPAEHARVWRRAEVRLGEEVLDDSRPIEATRLIVAAQLLLAAVAEQYEILAEEKDT